MSKYIRKEGQKEQRKEANTEWTKMCIEIKNEMKKYIRKEAKKEIMIDIYEECKMQCV